MKLFSIIVITFFLGKGCNSEAQNDLKNAVVEYTANKRGFYQKIVVHNQTITFSKDREGSDKPVAKKINNADWKVLVALFETLQLDSLANLKAPTEKRFYDGAAIGNLTVKYKQKVFESASFDHGAPPAAIEKIVTKINSLAKTE